MVDLAKSLIPKNSRGGFEDVLVELVHPEKDPAGSVSKEFKLTWKSDDGRSATLDARISQEISISGTGFEAAYRNKRWPGSKDSGIRLALVNRVSPQQVQDFGQTIVPNFDPNNERQVSQLERELGAMVAALRVERVASDDWKKTLRISSTREDC